MPRTACRSAIRVSASCARHRRRTGSTASPVASVDLEARVQGFIESIDYLDGEAVKKDRELFKIEKGRIRKIEALLHRSPYGMASGWSTWNQGMSDSARDVTME